MNPQVTVAGALLRQSRVGSKLPHLNALWNSDVWVEQPSQCVDAVAEVSRDGAKVNLYPALSACRQPQKELLCEFGIVIFTRAGDPAKQLWEQKLTLPSSQAVESFQAKLRSGRFVTYRAIVDDFKTAADRFTALNLANALIANYVPLADSTRLNLKDWGPTAEYATGRRRHRLACVLSAYCTRRMLECYGESFSDLVLNELRGVKETSVADAFRSLLEEIAELAR